MIYIINKCIVFRRTSLYLSTLIMAYWVMIMNVRQKSKSYLPLLIFMVSSNALALLLILNDCLISWRNYSNVLVIKFNRPQSYDCTLTKYSITGVTQSFKRNRTFDFIRLAQKFLFIRVPNTIKFTKWFDWSERSISFE